jgi:hypothetical protein
MRALRSPDPSSSIDSVVIVCAAGGLAHLGLPGSAPGGWMLGVGGWWFFVGWGGEGGGGGRNHRAAAACVTNRKRGSRESRGLVVSSGFQLAAKFY